MKVKINWSEGWSTMGTAFYMQKAFKELGHTVVYADEKDTNVDLVLNIDGYEHVPFIPDTPYFYWETDSFLQREPINEHSYDMIFIGGCPEDLPKYPKGTVFLPHAFDEDLHKPMPVNQDLDIVMVGSNYDERGRLIGLLQKYFKTEHLHTGPGLEYSEAMSRGKLIFNRSKSDINIPMRFFEGLAIGALLTNDPGNLSTYATPYEHYIPYTNDDEMLRNAEKYLEDDELRLDLASKARKHALSNHTYKHRVKEILSYL